MLYVTTKSNFYSETAPKALQSDTGADGGLYVPFKMPDFTREQLGVLLEKPFGEIVAEVLDLFFACRLTGSDVDFALGGFPIKLTQMSHRIIVAETWRNVENHYERTQRELAWLVCDKLGCPRKLTSWLAISVRIAVLFGVFGELIRSGVIASEQKIDISVPTGDFSVGFSFWLCRSMGLPIANIICSCNENSSTWDLFHLGQMYTNTALVHTTTPLCDVVVPTELERLVHAVLGTEEATAYTQCVAQGLVYRPAEGKANELRKGMFSAVVSRSRLDALIPSVYRTNSYILGTYTALAYGGLMDYRAKTGESRTALILAERSPVCDEDVVADAMQISVPQLRAKLNNN